MLAKQLIRIAERGELALARIARVERHRVDRRSDPEAPACREPGIAETPEAAHAHRVDRAPLALHERIEVRDLREQRVARAAVVERGETVDRFQRACGDAAPAAARLHVRGARACQRRQRVFAGQRPERLGPRAVRDDDAAAGLAHERRRARHVVRREHGLAVRPRLGDLRDESRTGARDRDRAREREERRALAIGERAERDDENAARAHRGKRRRIVAHREHVRAPVRHALHRLGVQRRARHDVDAAVRRCACARVRPARTARRRASPPRRPCTGACARATRRRRPPADAPPARRRAAARAARAPRRRRPRAPSSAPSRRRTGTRRSGPPTRARARAARASAAARRRALAPARRPARARHRAARSAARRRTRRGPAPRRETGTRGTAPCDRSLRGRSCRPARRASSSS